MPPRSPLVRSWVPVVDVPATQEPRAGACRPFTIAPSPPSDAAFPPRRRRRRRLLRRRARPRCQGRRGQVQTSARQRRHHRCEAPLRGGAPPRRRGEAATGRSMRATRRRARTSRGARAHAPRTIAQWAMPRCDPLCGRDRRRPLETVWSDGRATLRGSYEQNNPARTLTRAPRRRAELVLERLRWPREALEGIPSPDTAEQAGGTSRGGARGCSGPRRGGRRSTSPRAGPRQDRATRSGVAVRRASCGARRAPRSGGHDRSSRSRHRSHRSSRSCTRARGSCLVSTPHIASTEHLTLKSFSRQGRLRCVT